MSNQRAFINHKLHSLLGLIPLGGFLFIHLLTQYMAVRGPEAFNSAAHFLESLPFLLVLEFGVIYLPITFHAVYGIYLAFKSKNNVKQYSYFRNHMFLWQRVTGVITFVFVLWHVWETRIQYALGKAELDFSMMVNILDNPYSMFFYVLGVLAATFHFANGFWSFLVHWGITVGPRAQRISTYVSFAIFAAFSYIGIRAIIAFM